MRTEINGTVESYVTYEHDDLNRVTDVFDHDPALVTWNPDEWLKDGTVNSTEMQYNRLGQMTSISRPNDVTTTYTYGDITAIADIGTGRTENPYQVYEIDHSHEVDGLISQYAYEYDGANNRSAMSISTPNSPQMNITYEYDRANRMIEESYQLIGNASSDTTYQYDRAGNRTQMRDSSDDITRYTYNVNDELTRVDMPDYYFEDYTYDSKGNLTLLEMGGHGAYGATNYAYNARDLLSRITLPTTQRVDYEYDYLGNRVREEMVGTQDPTLYLWDEFSQWGDVILETGVNFGDGSLYHKMDYTLAGSMLISQTDDTDLTGYFLSDAQGTTRVMTDDTGAISSEYQYNAFGELDESIDPLSAETSYLYAGQQFDGYSELYSMRARYYDPTQGRFMTRDTWAYNYSNPFELNRYAYGANNPSTFTDPSGHFLIELGLNMALQGGKGAVAGGAGGFAASSIYSLMARAGWCGDDAQANLMSDVSLSAFILASTLTGMAIGAGIGAGMGFIMYTSILLTEAAPLATPLVMKLAGDLQMFGLFLTGASIVNGFAQGFCTGVATVVGIAAGAGAGLGMGAGAGGGSGGGSGNPDINLPALPTSNLPAVITESTAITSIASLVANGYAGNLSGNGLAPCNSFSADTTVETTEGDVPISEIEIGDTVIAYDEETGETGEYTVTDTINHEDDQIAYVTIDGEEIETTPWHLFYTDDGWVEAGDLQEGDTVVSLSDYGTVDTVIIVDAIQTMYDLTVEEVHTFAVGDGDWVVHNCTVDVDLSDSITFPSNVERQLRTVLNRHQIGNHCDRCADQLYNVLNRNGYNVRIAHILNRVGTFRGGDGRGRVMEVHKADGYTGDPRYNRGEFLENSTTGFHDVVEIDGQYYLDLNVYAHTGQVVGIPWEQYIRLWRYPEDPEIVSYRVP